MTLPYPPPNVLPNCCQDLSMFILWYPYLGRLWFFDLKYLLIQPAILLFISPILLLIDLPLHQDLPINMFDDIRYMRLNHSLQYPLFLAEIGHNQTASWCVLMCPGKTRKKESLKTTALTSSNLGQVKFLLFDDFGSFQSQLWPGGIPILNFWQNPVKKILEGFWILANFHFLAVQIPRYPKISIFIGKTPGQKHPNAMATQLS